VRHKETLSLCATADAPNYVFSSTFVVPFLPCRFKKIEVNVSRDQKPLCPHSWWLPSASCPSSG